jgi:L-rhamnose mutarotase
VKCFAQAIDLVDDPELIAEYRAHHQRVWPEVVSALHDIGIIDMRIYLLGTRLFMYAQARDGFDPKRDYQRYAEDPRCREWDALMRRYQRPAPGHDPAHGWWTAMEEVFDLAKCRHQ